MLTITTAAPTAVKERVRGGNQDPAELAQFLDLVRTLKVRSYLEVGCRNGDTFDAVMRTIGQGGYGLAIDLPENADARQNLEATVADLERSGISAELLLGNSQNRAVIEHVRSRGPFDLILIDADHRYQGIKADFGIYGELAPVIALHDVMAPRGHMSDGYPNGVGVFWNEIKDKFRHQEFASPGSQMGFGVLHREDLGFEQAIIPPKDAESLVSRRFSVEEIARVHSTAPPLFIACPAWGDYYVDLACRFTIPAILESLKLSSFNDVTFLIHTDNQDAFRKAIGSYPIKFMRLMQMSPPPDKGKMPRLPDNYWVAFKQAHKDAINATRQGGVVVLLNSDVVMSRECFSFVEQELGRGKKVVASVGIRTQIEDNDGPPIGVSANELFTWIWGHRHHITEECIWDHGRSHHPTILFFDDKAGNVAMHCFHLTPMFIFKDRVLQFKGTIDDDLLMRYADDEVSYISGGDVAFAEISPNWKTHPFGKSLNVPDVLEFWRRRMMRPHYLRNFRQRMRVLGNPVKNHHAVDEIIAGLSK